MNATTLAAVYGPLSGSDLEAELAQTRIADGDARDAAILEHAGGAAVVPLSRRSSAAESTHDDAVTLRGVSKRYGARTVLDDVHLGIARGSFVAIVGRSGCGKSTLLRLVAGLEQPSAGAFTTHGEGGALDTRIMYQDARLLPWKTVLQNVMLGLGRGAREDARAVLDEVGLLERADDWPAQLSGGQRQRVALGRALARDPALFLFDEPLSNLDAKLRIEMRAEIKLLHQRLGTTIVYVTHDQIEAMTLGDRIAVMKDGVVQQFGAPQEIYDSPANLFVAGFIGAPPMNFINGRLVEQGSGVGLEIDTGVSRGVLNLPFDAATLKAHIGREVILGLRPERITDARNAHNGEASRLQPVDVRVDVTEPTGPDTHVFAQLNGKRIVSRVHPAANPQPAQTLSLLFDVSKAVLFDPASEERIA